MNPMLGMFRNAFREFCSNTFILRQIRDIFGVVGIQPREVQLEHISGQRRTLVEQYYAALDWENQTDIQKFLQVVSLSLVQAGLDEGSRQHLKDLCIQHGLVIDGNTVRLSHSATGSNIKNIISAAIGPKPEIVLSDSLSNEIKIVKNADGCLIYDRPIPSEGLRWVALLEWWSSLDDHRRHGEPPNESGLYKRLHRSLGSNPEQLLLLTYFTKFVFSTEADTMPALIPQVYLHYDPYTLRQRGGIAQLPRQRMDFLLLFPENKRVVIEIDGKQHYAEGDLASPRLYAEMVAEDRRLKLAGYEIFRIGGYEFVDSSKAMEMIGTFFRELFDHYNC